MSRSAWLPLAIMVIAGCGSSAPTAGSAADSTSVAGRPSESVATISVRSGSVGPGTTGEATATGGRPVPVPISPPASLDPRSPLTLAANGGSLSVQVGDTLSVRLEPPNSFQAWDRLTIAAPIVLEVRSTSGGYPGRDPLVATIVATANGTTTVSTQSDQACFHETLPCRPPTIGWSVTVTVR